MKTPRLALAALFGCSILLPSVGRPCDPPSGSRSYGGSGGGLSVPRFSSGGTGGGAAAGQLVGSLLGGLFSGGSGGGGYEPRVSLCANDHELPVGEQHCRRFGKGWNERRVLPIVLSLGARWTGRALGGLQARGRANHGGVSHDYVLADSDDSQRLLHLAGAEVQVRIHALPWLTVGGSVSLGMAVSGPEDFYSSSGQAHATMNNGMDLGASLDFGTAALLGPLSLRAELSLGYRSAFFTFTSRSLDCLEEMQLSHEQVFGRAKLSAAVFVSPQASVGLSGFAEFSDTLNAGGTLFAEWHFRAFDGARDPSLPARR